MADIIAMVESARRAFEALSPEEQKAHRAAQRRSFVRGELMMANPTMTAEEADALIAGHDSERSD